MKRKYLATVTVALGCLSAFGATAETIESKTWEGEVQCSPSCEIVTLPGAVSSQRFALHSKATEGESKAAFASYDGSYVQITGFQLKGREPEEIYVSSIEHKLSPNRVRDVSEPSDSE